MGKFEKSNFCPKIQFWQNPNIFTSFLPNFFFLTIFLVKSKLSTAKKSKTTTFSRVFHPKKIDNFLGKSKLNFWTKNEDFEQCDQFIQFCLLFCPYLQFFDNKIIKIPGEKSQLFFCSTLSWHTKQSAQSWFGKIHQ